MTINKPAVRVIAFAAVAMMSAACVGMPKEHREVLINRSGVDLIGSPADRVQIAIKDKTSFERYCMGEAPDVALTASGDVILGGPSIGGATPVPVSGGKVSGGSSRGALDLGGRNPAVLIARTLLYRACELSLNINADPQTTISIYKMTMDSIERISALQTGTGGVATAAAPPPSFPGLPPDLQISTSTAASPASP